MTGRVRYDSDRRVVEISQAPGVVLRITNVTPAQAEKLKKKYRAAGVPNDARGADPALLTR